jgi:hypothetical protein
MAGCSWPHAGPDCGPDCPDDRPTGLPDCEACGYPMVAEQAHNACRNCGHQEGCCQGAPLPPVVHERSGTIELRRGQR